MNRTPTALILALALVACCLIGSTALVIITADQSEIPEGWLALFFGVLSTVVTGLVSIVRTEQIATKLDQQGKQVNDLTNGVMDRKIVSGVHEAMNQRDDGGREDPEV